MSSKTKRIGIYAGTFDPVHAGHVSFALQAIEAAGLDCVYFLPERRPHRKQGVEHFGHRVAMLKKAARPHRKLKVLELEDVSFTVKTSLPRLQNRFSGAELSFLVGSDVASQIIEWPNANRLLQTSELIVGVRTEDSESIMQNTIAAWPVQPRALHVFTSHASAVSSRSVREALNQRRYVPGLLKSVEHYSNRNWLYVSVANAHKLQSKTQ